MNKKLLIVALVGAMGSSVFAATPALTPLERDYNKMLVSRVIDHPLIQFVFSFEKDALAEKAEYELKEGRRLHDQTVPTLSSFTLHILELAEKIRVYLSTPTQ